MWQLRFGYWAFFFLVLLIVFFFPAIPKGQYLSAWLAMLACARLLENADLLSKNWAGGHWLWITKGYLFNNIWLLAPLLDPPAAPPSVTVLGLSPSSQSGLSHVSLLLPFPTAYSASLSVKLYCALSCQGGSAPSLCWASPVSGYNLLLSSATVICSGVPHYLATRRQHTQTGSEAGLALKPLSSWKSLAVWNTSVAEEVLWCYAY